jgi:hypothetical protein
MERKSSEELKAELKRLLDQMGDDSPGLVHDPEDEDEEDDDGEDEEDEEDNGEL